MGLKRAFSTRMCSIQSRTDARANDAARAVKNGARTQKTKPALPREPRHLDRTRVPSPASTEVRSQPPPFHSQPLPSSLAINALQRRVVGFVLTDLNFKPTYTNDAAISILTFPDSSQPTVSAAAIAQRIRAILNADRFTPGLAAANFVSGKRQYVCRPFLLESRESRTRPPMITLLLERHVRETLPLSEISRQFHLSPRECETVQYLIRGLTTKEVAQHMSVSPNTVKQFVRLIMSKVGVTTRSGIVGKLVSG